jgi:DNA-binding transcriptional regulator YiaG
MDKTQTALFIKMARGDAGLNTDQFSRVIGVKSYNLSRYEHGVVMPPAVIILRIIAIYPKTARFIPDLF